MTIKDCRKNILIFIEKRSFLELLVSFIFVTIFYAILFTRFTPGDHGVLQTNDENKTFTIVDGLYFSVVTISSLGYGDMHPKGLSRLLAVSEVIFGLALMGVLIAKLTSHRLSYHVKRIYANDAIKKLDSYAGLFLDCIDRLKRFKNIYEDLLLETPKPRAVRKDENKDTIMIRANKLFSNSIEDFNTSLRELHSFLEYEVNNGDFFSELPSDSFKKNGNYIDNYLLLLSQSLLGWADKTRNNLLYGNPGRSLSESLELSKNICQIVIKNSSEEKTKLVFSNLLSSTNDIGKNFMLVTIPISEFLPPDQKSENNTEL